MKPRLITFLMFALVPSIVMAQSSVQKVLIEEHTGAWCGNCPDGHVVLENVLGTHQNAIGVMVHNNDGMDNVFGNSLSAFYVQGFPQATFNREGSAISRSLWMSQTTSVLSGTAPVTVSFDSVLYNPTTRKLSVFLAADFTANESGNLRFNAIVVEDSVTGTGSDYNQVNYFNGSSGHPMFGLGNPIVGYVHDAVTRIYLGGAFGTFGSLPSTVSNGERHTYQYNITLPASYDDTKIWLVGMVSKYEGSGTSSRPILNAESTHDITIINYHVDVEENAPSIQAVYPNPAQDVLFINAANDGVQTVTLHNMLGQEVFATDIMFAAGQPYPMDVSTVTPGMYILRLGNSSEQIIIQ